MNLEKRLAAAEEELKKFKKALADFERHMNHRLDQITAELAAKS